MKKTILISVLSLFSIALFAQPIYNKTAVKSEAVKKISISIDTATEVILPKEVQKEVANQVVEIKELTDSIVITKKQLAISEAKSDLWGGVSPVTYLVGLFFAFIGIFINTAIATKKAIKAGGTSPPKFSWSYWWKNNMERIMRWLGVLAIIFVGMRFSNEILNQNLTMFLAFLLGFCLDYFIEILKGLKLKK